MNHPACLVSPAVVVSLWSMLLRRDCLRRLLGNTLPLCGENETSASAEVINITKFCCFRTLSQDMP